MTRAQLRKRTDNWSMADMIRSTNANAWPRSAAWRRPSRSHSINAQQNTSLPIAPAGATRSTPSNGRQRCAASTAYTYGTTSNRLAQLAGSQNTSIATDANGSITNNGNATFNYDARGRMVSANTAIGLVSYKINALGQRVQKTTPTSTTVYHYDGSGKLIAESTDGTLTEYVYLGDMPIAVLK